MAPTVAYGAAVTQPQPATDGMLSNAQGPSPPATPAASIILPEKPLFVLRASRSWVPLNLRDLWIYRELLYFLIWRDVKVRYRQTVLGVAWAVIQPLCAMLIFTVFFGRLAGIKSEDIPYPLFAYAGLLPWTFFANALTNSGNSLVGSQNLITKVYFPRMVIPMAAVAAGLVDFGIAFLLLLGLMAWYRVVPGVGLLLLPLLTIVISLLAMGVGMWMSALNVKYRDIRYALPFVTQLWMFVSPVIYPASVVPAKYRWILAINPLTGLIEGFRAALFARAVDWQGLAVSTLLTAGIVLYALYAFRRMEREFADIV